jgi:hypothetical protein
VEVATLAAVANAPKLAESSSALSPRASSRTHRCGKSLDGLTDFHETEVIVRDSKSFACRTSQSVSPAVLFTWRRRIVLDASNGVL